MKFRDAIFWLHLCCGVFAGVVILIMSVTGTMLAFEPQIVSFAERQVRKITPPKPPTSQLTLEALLAAARTHKPDGKPGSLVLQSDPASAVAIGFGREDTIYLNPYTGEILGQGSKIQDLMDKIEVWHRWIGMEGNLKPFGHQVKGVANIIFLMIIVSGFYLWWPSQWNFKAIKNIILFNRSAKGKARDWNWHNVIGFWCAPFLIVISLTGLIMTYSWATNLLYRMTGNEPPAKMSEGKGPGEKKSKGSEKKPEEKSIGLDVIVAKAKEKVPQWSSINVRLPQKDGGPVNVTIENSSFFKPNRRSQLTLNSLNAEITKWEPIEEQNLGRRLRLWARYLHTGEALGFWGQLFAFVASAGAVLLVWTGLALSWQRFSSWRQKRIAAQI